MGEVRNVKLYGRKKVGNKERKQEAKKVFLRVLRVHVERKSNEKYLQGKLFFPLFQHAYCSNHSGIEVLSFKLYFGSAFCKRKVLKCFTKLRKILCISLFKDLAKENILLFSLYV